MPGPFSALSKLQKAEIARQMDEVIVVDGREIRKGDLMEFEIEKRLGAGQGTEDIMKALRKQGMNVPSEYVKERMAVARGRKPIEGDRGYDRRYARMELNFIIERGLANGDDWDTIGNSIRQSFPKAHVDKLIEAAKNKRAKIIQQNSPPAVIDTGESGPNAGPEQPPYADPTNPVRDLKEFEGMDDAGLAEVLKKVGDEALKRKRAQVQGLREKGAQQAEQFDWSQLDELGRQWAEGPDLRFAKASEGGDPVQENLDVPIEQPGLKGPVEPEFRNR